MGVLISIDVKNWQDDPFVCSQHVPDDTVAVASLQHFSDHVHACGWTDPFSCVNSSVEKENPLRVVRGLDLEDEITEKEHRKF